MSIETTVSRSQVPTENPRTADASHRRDETVPADGDALRRELAVGALLGDHEDVGARLQQLLVPGPDLDERRLRRSTSGIEERPGFSPRGFIVEQPSM